MKAIIKISIIPLLVLFLLNSCAKPKKLYRISQFTRDYIDFPIGSWWIYKDSATGKTECIELRDAKSYKENVKFEQARREVLEHTFYSSFKKVFYSQIGRARYDDDSDSYSGYWLFVDFSKYKHYDGNIDSILVNNVLYYDVVTINDDYKIDSLSLERTYYWAKGIGVVKFKADLMVWELQKYYINR